MKKNIPKTFLFIFILLSLFSCNKVKDIDGNKYRTLKIGNQIWFSENLEVSHFSNGDTIYEAKSVLDWNKYFEQGKPAFIVFYFNNDDSDSWNYSRYQETDDYNYLISSEKTDKKKSNYVKLVYYNWYALNDERGLVPKGYRIPTKNDFEKLFISMSEDLPIDNSVYTYVDDNYEEEDDFFSNSENDDDFDYAAYNFNSNFSSNWDMHYVHYDLYDQLKKGSGRMYNESKVDWKFFSNYQKYVTEPYYTSYAGNGSDLYGFGAEPFGLFSSSSKNKVDFLFNKALFYLNEKTVGDSVSTFVLQAKKINDYYYVEKYPKSCGFTVRCVRDKTFFDFLKRKPKLNNEQKLKKCIYLGDYYFNRIDLKDIGGSLYKDEIASGDIGGYSFDKAIYYYSKALEYTDDSLDETIILKKAITYFFKSQHSIDFKAIDKSIKEIQKSKNYSDPGYYSIDYFLISSFIYMMSNNFSLAAKNYELARKDFDNSSNYWMRMYLNLSLGIAYSNSNQPQKALHPLLQSLNDYENIKDTCKSYFFYDIHTALGNVKKELGDYTDAIDEYNLVIKGTKFCNCEFVDYSYSRIDYRPLFKYFDYGFIWGLNIRLHHYLIGFFRNFINSSQKNAIISIAGIYEEMKDYRKAIQTYSKCIENDYDSDIIKYIAFLKLKINDYHGAIEDYSKLINNILYPNLKKNKKGIIFGVPYISDLENKTENINNSKIDEVSSSVKQIDESDKKELSELYIKRANVWVMLNNNEKACSDYRKARDYGATNVNDFIKKNCN